MSRSSTPHVAAAHEEAKDGGVVLELTKGNITCHSIRPSGYELDVADGPVHVRPLLQSGCRPWPGALSVKLLEITGFPGLVEPGLERAVKPQEHEVALAGHGLDPVVVLSLGSRRSEVHRIGTVVVGLQLRVRAVDAGTPLVRFEKRPRLPVVDSEGPEVVGRDRRRKRD